jgi:hypothetical protein
LKTQEVQWLAAKDDILFSFEELAERWRVHVDRLKRKLNELERNGEIKIIRLGFRTARIRLSDILRLEEEAAVNKPRGFQRVFPHQKPGKEPKSKFLAKSSHRPTAEALSLRKHQADASNSS